MAFIAHQFITELQIILFLLGQSYVPKRSNGFARMIEKENWREMIKIRTNLVGIKIKRDLQPRHVLNKSLKRTYDEFNTENKSDRNISFSKFSKMRPKAVQTLNTAKFRFCLCERCINMEMKLKAINLKMCNKSRYRQVRGQPHDSLWPWWACVIRHSRHDVCPSIMWPMWDAKTSKVSMWETVYFPTWQCGI